MPSVEKKHDRENIESMLRRFKRACEKADTLIEIRKREFFEKPSSIRKRKRAAAIKREQKRISTDFSKRRKLY